MKSTPIQTISDKSALFEHWTNVPTVVFIEDQYYEGVNQEIRSHILEILRVGIVDFNPVSNKSAQRHVLNAEELYKIVKTKIKRRITIQTIFFHLNYLKGHGDLVDEVFRLKGSKNLIRYFSRTGKYFIFTKYSTYDQYISDQNSQIEATKKYLKILHPTIPASEIDKKVNNAGLKEFETMRKRSNELKKWVESNIQLLEKNSIDHWLITNFLTKNVPINLETTSLFKEIYKLLNFDI